MTVAVVLGGGGSAGVSWEIGVLRALAEAGLDIDAADRLIGTSAGAVVASQIRAGRAIEVMYERAGHVPDGPAMDIDFAAVAAGWAVAAQGATSADDARRRIGALALAAGTISREQRRDQIAALLAADTWPDRDFEVTAVSAETGRFHTFTRESGVDYVAAIGASCAVPGVWPPVLIEGEYFMDGAVRSPTNTSVARGYDRVLVLAPLVPTLGGGLIGEIAKLGPDTIADVISADDQATAAFGANPLDPSVGPAAAAEGLRQGRAAAERARAVLTA